MNNPFKNTYIKTEHLSEHELKELAKKYSQASGYPLASDESNWAYTWNYLSSVKHKNDDSDDPVDTISSADKLKDLVIDSCRMKEITEDDLDNHLENSMNKPILKPGTKYKIKSKGQLLEIKAQCEKQGIFWPHGLEGNVGTLYIHDRDVGFDYWGLDSWPNYKLLELTSPYPDFDFKIDLSGMSEQEKESAKKWLCKVAEYRGLDYDVLSQDGNYNYFWFEDDMCKCVSRASDNESELYHTDYVKELFLTFSEPEVEAFYTKDEEPSEKELQLQQLIDNLQSQLEEVQQELTKIKN